MTATVAQQVRQIVADAVWCETTDPRLDLPNFYDSGIVDSLDFVEIIMAIEDDFNIALDDEVIENIRSIKELADHVQSVLDGLQDLQDEE